jgi:MFS family permease
MLLIPTGKVADIYGRKKIFTIGIGVFAFSLIFLSISTHSAMLIVFRFIQGIGSALIFATGVAILSSVFPPEQTGVVFGINVAGIYTGLMIGPSLGGVLTQHLGWKSVFWIGIPFLVIILAMIFILIKGEWYGEKDQKLDYIGIVIYGLILLSLMYGFSLLPELRSLWFIVAGIVLLPVFVFWERRTKTPVLDFKMFRNKYFNFSNVAAIFFYISIAAIGYLISIFLQNILGFSPQRAGAILIAQYIFQALFSPVAGYISDRVEPRIIASIGSGLTIVGLLIFSFINEGTHLASIIIGLIFMGTGVAIFSSPNTKAIMSAVDKESYGSGSAIRATMRLIGQNMGFAIVLILFAIFIGRVEITPAVYPQLIRSTNLTFQIAAGAAFIGLILSIFRGNISTKPEKVKVIEEN